MGENGIVSVSCDGGHTSLQDPNLIESAVEIEHNRRSKDGVNGSRVFRVSETYQVTVSDL